MAVTFGSRRDVFVDIQEEMQEAAPLAAQDLQAFDRFDLIYRSLCAMRYNYVPTSGHPGGSISSGRFVASLLFDAMDNDVALPDREEADIISYAAGHKALGEFSLTIPRFGLLSRYYLSPQEILSLQEDQHAGVEN